jgi:hypothetical protein
MRRIKTMGLCLVAVFAITAMASASASAAPPEYFGMNSCTKKFEALWNGGQCVTGTYKTTVPTPAGQTAIKVSNKAKAGEEAKITALSGGAPLKTGKTYFVVAPTTSTLSLAETKGGAAIALTEELKSATFQVEKKLAAQKIAFTSKGAASKLDGGLVIECAVVESKGSTEGSTKTVKLVSKFSACHLGGLKTTCHTKLPTEAEGEGPGIITTASIKGHLAEASETKGGALVVAQELEPEKTPFEFAKFTCGKKGETKVSVKGKILFQPKPVFSGPTPEEKNDSLFGESIAEAKSVITGCGGQKFLFENGTGECLHLRTVENGKELEPSWDEFKTEQTSKSAIQIYKGP